MIKETEMQKIILLISIFILSHNIFAKEMSCFPKAEFGEGKNGDNLYERTDKLRPESMSKIDFDNLVIINADTGAKTRINKANNNQFYLKGSPFNWYYVVNDSRTIVIETSVDEMQTYSKILFCK